MQLARDANDVVAPGTGRPLLREFAHRHRSLLIHLARINAQESVLSRSNSHVARHLNCDGQHKPQIVVRVFPNQIHAARGPIDLWLGSFREMTMKETYNLVRTESQSRHPPKTDRKSTRLNSSHVAIS